MGNQKPSIEEGQTIQSNDGKKENKLFSYFFALSLLFLDIDACDFKSFDFYLSHFIHAFVYSHQYIMCF